MTLEKWQEVLGNIKDTFEVEESSSEHLDQEGGIDIEFVVFNSPQGRFRLEFASQPAVLDKKTTFSRRIGSETTIEYVYSETDKTCKLMAYRWDNGSETWQEMDSANFS